MLLDFYLRPHKQQLQCILNSYSIVIGSAVHEELYEVKEIFAFSCLLVQSAPLVHVYVFFLSYFLVQPLIEFP